MAGVSGGRVQFRALTANSSAQSITFADGDTSLAGNTAVEVLAYAGVAVEQNISSSAGYLRFDFFSQPMTVAAHVSISTSSSGGHIVLATGASNPQTVSFDLPSGVQALDAAADLSIAAPLVVNRDSAARETFHLYAGRLLSFCRPMHACARARNGPRRALPVCPSRELFVRI